jgi:hypothetical protein
VRGMAHHPEVASPGFDVGQMGAAGADTPAAFPHGSMGARLRNYAATLFLALLVAAFIVSILVVFP